MISDKKGISLVALVITIIVLIILTGAVVLSLGGENNIIARAQDTTKEHNKSVMVEQVLLEVANYKIEAIKANKTFGQYVADNEVTIEAVIRAEGLLAAIEGQAMTYTNSKPELAGYSISVDSTGMVTVNDN